MSLKTFLIKTIFNLSLYMAAFFAVVFLSSSFKTSDAQEGWPGGRITNNCPLRATAMDAELTLLSDRNVKNFLYWQYSGDLGGIYIENDDYSFYKDDPLCQVLQRHSPDFDVFGVNMWNLNAHVDIAGDILDYLKTCGVKHIRIWAPGEDANNGVVGVLDVAAGKGIKVIVNLFGTVNDTGFFAGGYTGDYTAHLTSLVNRIKNHPALYGYELANEPHCNGFASCVPSYVEWAHNSAQLVYQLDGGRHPISLGQMAGQPGTRGDSTDIGPPSDFYLSNDSQYISMMSGHYYTRGDRERLLTSGMDDADSLGKEFYIGEMGMRCDGTMEDGLAGGGGELAVCELDNDGYMREPLNRIIIKGTIKSEGKLLNDNGALEGNKYANGVFVKAFAGSWLYGTGKERNGQICDNTTCVNPTRVDGMCAVSGRTRDYAGGDEFGCELLADDCDPLTERGGCNGKFTLQTYKSRHNFNNSNYLAFYCGSDLKMLLSVGLSGIAEIDPETGSPVINMNVSLDCEDENPPTELTECVDYIARDSYLLCEDPNGFDGGVNAVGGDFESARGLKLKDADPVSATWQETDRCPPGYTEDPPGTCNPPDFDGNPPPGSFPIEPMQAARVETELWEKLTNEASDIAAIPNSADRLLAGNPWCDMVVPAPYSDELNTALPPCDVICKGNYPVSDENYNLAVNQRMCGGVSSNLFTPYEWEDQCNSMVTSPSTTPVCCMDPTSDGASCPDDQIVYFDEVQPPTPDGLENPDDYRLLVDCFPYSMCYTGNRVHAQNETTNEVTNDVPVKIVPPDAAKKQQPHSNTDEKPFLGFDVITTPVGSYETYGKFKNQINLSPVQGLVDRSRAAVFSTPYRDFGLDFDDEGNPAASEDARFPKLGRGIYVITSNGPLPSNCVYNFYDTGVSEVNNTFNRSSDCEWCPGGEYISDKYPGEQRDAAEFKTKGVNTDIFSVIGWLADFFANFLGLNTTNWDSNKASGPCTINGGDSCTLSGEASCTGADPPIDCADYCDAQRDDDPSNDIPNPGDCCIYTNRPENYVSASLPTCGTIEYPIRIQFIFEGFNKNDESAFAGSQFYAQFRPPYENDFHIGQVYTYDCKAEKEKDPDNGACMGLDIGRGGPALGEYYMDKVGELMGDWSF